MKRQLNKKEMKAWVIRMGGAENAAILIKEALECSYSKADKIAGCRYPSVPQPTEQMTLASLLGCSRDELYPLAGRPRASAAS